MNRVYHVVWNQGKGVWQAASELSQSNQSSSGSAGSVIGSLKTISAGALLLIALPLHASNLPSGGTVVGGQGNINSSDKTLTVNQKSQNMAIDWQEFSIAEGHTVNFNQPNAQAAALNRVTGNNVSDIRGALNANGRVFLVNPNGVMFSSTARVDVGSLVTSTLDISTEDFMAGNYHFEGASANAIVNRGNITTAEGGVVAMIAAEIINTGNITTPEGSALMGAGSKVTLDLGGPLKIEVEEALLDTYIEQGGAIRADGGLVYLTAKATGNLASSVINHTGVTEARTLATGEDGQIMLMGDMDSGQVQVAGTLDASAPQGGDGGFIETSAAKVAIDHVQATTRADNGQTGEWLIDPNDYTIAASGGDMTGAQLGTNLADTDVTIASIEGSDANGNGDIFVNDEVTWASGNTLTLNAIRNIEINSTIDASGGSGGKLALEYGQGSAASGNTADYSINAPVNLKAGQNFSTQLGNDGAVVDYTVITEAGDNGSTTGTDLQGINGSLSGHYALGADIDIKALAWNPLGDGNTPFTGSFDGLGHTISNLDLYDTNTWAHSAYLGLFGYIGHGASVQNVGLVDLSVRRSLSLWEFEHLISSVFMGGMAGVNEGTIRNVYATGSLDNYLRAAGTFHDPMDPIGGGFATNNSQINHFIGGLTGSNRGVIENSYVTAEVSSSESGSFPSSYSAVGGLTGSNEEVVKNSYASNRVYENSYSLSDVGGLTGDEQSGGIVENSFYDTDQNPWGSGDYGRTKAEILMAFSGKTGWGTEIDGSDIEGYGLLELPFLTGITKDADKSVTTLFASGLGVEGDAYTITDWKQLQNINYSADVLDGGYVFALANVLDSSSSGYDDLASATANDDAGWSPIGGDSNNFNGTFDGQSHTITGLTINSGSYTGLFGRIGASGVVRNIGLLGGSVKGQYAGMLAGMNFGSITNAYATGTVTGSTSSYSGGLVGFNQGGGSITNSYATGDVSGTQSGGLVGFNLGSGSIATAYATGDVNGIEEAGGLVGFNSGSIINAYATGVVSGNNNAGGLAGFSSGSITNTYATGAASGSTSSGGLVGFSPGGSVNSSYYATTDAYGNAIDENYDSNTGEGKSVADLQTASTFTDWDLSTSGGSGVWRLYEGQTSPLLRRFMTVATVSGNSDPVSRVYDASTQFDNDLLDLNWVTTDGSSFNSNLLQGSGFSLDSKNVGNRNLTHDLYSGQTGYDIVIDPSLTNKQVEVTPFALSLDGLSAADKTYDGSKSATLIGLGMINAFSGDSVTLSGNATGNFVDKNAGIDKAVTLSGVTLGGADAANYSLSLPTDWTASINKKAITVSGITAADKVYDANTNATVSITDAEGWIEGDDVQVDASGTFADKHAGSDKTVNLNSSYSGADIDNYTITGQSSTTASIDRLAIIVSDITAENRVYDGTTDATVDSSNASGWITDDDVQVTATGAFSNKHVGTDKAIALSSEYTGVDVDNYTITDQATATADIDRLAITVNGITAADRVYDATTRASIDASAATGWIAGDDVQVSAFGTFADKHAEADKTVTLSSNYSGGDEGNYTITDQASTTADINAKSITVSSITAEDRVYDGTTDVTVNSLNANGWITGDDVQVKATGTFVDRDAGSNKTVNLSSDYTGSDVANYTITDQSDTTANIEQRALTLALSGSASRVYNGSTDIEFTGHTLATIGAINGDALIIDTESVIGSTDKNVGENKPVLFGGFQLSGTDAGNYKLMSQSAYGKTAITPRDLVVSAHNQSKLNGQADPTLTYDTGCGLFSADCGLVSGDQLAGTLSRENGEVVGRYAINRGTLGNPNYGIAFTPGVLEITSVNNPVLDRAIQSAQQTASTSFKQRNGTFGSATGMTDISLSGGGQSGSIEVVEIDGNSSQTGIEGQSSQGLGPLQMFIIDGGISLAEDS